MKILKAKNGVAEVILIKAGKKHGIKVGDRFNVESIEILDGEVLPTILGIVTVTALKGEAYTECKVGKKEGKVRTGAVFVDGLGVGDVGNIVLRDRRHLAQDGMLTIVVAIERETLSIVSGPDVITRGFVYVKESEELINKVKEISVIEVEKCLEIGVIEWYVLKSNVKKAVENYIYEKTKRRPTIIPIIMET